MYCKKITATVM